MRGYPVWPFKMSCAGTADNFRNEKVERGQELSENIRFCYGKKEHGKLA